MRNIKRWQEKFPLKYLQKEISTQTFFWQTRCCLQPGTFFLKAITDVLIMLTSPPSTNRPYLQKCLCDSFLCNGLHKTTRSIPRPLGSGWVYHKELCEEKQVIRNREISKFSVLPLEVQVVYWSSHFWWTTILKLVQNVNKTVLYSVKILCTPSP